MNSICFILHKKKASTLGAFVDLHPQNTKNIKHKKICNKRKNKNLQIEFYIKHSSFGNMCI